MAWSDDILGLAATPAGDTRAYEAASARLGTLPMEALVCGWRELSLASLRERTPGIDLFARYFDGLGANEPERACDFILAEVDSESDDEIVALIAREKLLMQLLYQHGARIAERLEAATLGRPRLRWLLGGIAWAIRSGMIQDEEIKALLLPVSDWVAWDRWVEETEGPAPPPSFATMAVPDLARAWVKIMPSSPVEKERDQDFRTLFDYQSDLVTEDPARGLTLVGEVLRIETHPRLLAILAAGLLEDLICTEKESVIAAVEAEARQDERFRWLLGGVWYSRVSPEVARRIDKAKDGISW
jgi:hypothetical protein